MKSCTSSLVLAAIVVLACASAVCGTTYTTGFTQGGWTLGAPEIAAQCVYPNLNVLASGGGGMGTASLRQNSNNAVIATYTFDASLLVSSASGNPGAIQFWWDMGSGTTCYLRLPFRPVSGTSNMFTVGGLFDGIVILPATMRGTHRTAPGTYVAGFGSGTVAPYVVSSVSVARRGCGYASGSYNVLVDRVSGVASLVKMHTSQVVATTAYSWQTTIGAGAIATFSFSACGCAVSIGVTCSSGTMNLYDVDQLLNGFHLLTVAPSAQPPHLAPGFTNGVYTVQALTLSPKCNAPAYYGDYAVTVHTGPFYNTTLEVFGGGSTLANFYFDQTHQISPSSPASFVLQWDVAASGSPCFAQLDIVAVSGFITLQNVNLLLDGTVPLHIDACSSVFTAPGLYVVGTTDYFGYQIDGLTVSGCSAYANTNLLLSAQPSNPVSTAYLRKDSDFSVVASVAYSYQTTVGNPTPIYTFTLSDGAGCSVVVDVNRATGGTSNLFALPQLFDGYTLLAVDANGNRRSVTADEAMQSREVRSLESGAARSSAGVALLVALLVALTALLH